MIRKLLLALACCLLLAATAQARPLHLVAGTTIISDILTDLCPQAEVRALIPGGACPGHYDLRPADLAGLAEADALVLHPWQRDLENMRALVNAAASPKLRVLVVPEPGNAMVPEVQARYVRALAAMLIDLAPQLRESINQAAGARLNRLEHLARQLHARLQAAGANNLPVTCCVMLVEQVRWAGFPVAATFARPGDMTPEQMAQVVDAGRAGKTGLVVDNLQTGDGGRGIAEELGARRVALSNFPDGFRDTGTWEKAFSANVERLIRCLAAPEGS
ncbi:metal ABC transporter solute-binding protein, Zn/Mn family [Desulfocurvus sp. DL9XJH121]